MRDLNTADIREGVVQGVRAPRVDENVLGSFRPDRRVEGKADVVRGGASVVLLS